MNYFLNATLWELLRRGDSNLWLQRIKQVVHQASKLNEAISAARGVPMARAQVTLGGYYDSL